MARQPAPPLYTRRPVLAGVLRQLPLTAVLLVIVLWQVAYSLVARERASGRLVGRRR